MSTLVAQFTAGSNFSATSSSPVIAIQRVAEAVAVEMGQELAILSVDLLVGEDHLVDAVVVPLVVGRHLIDPLRHAGVGVARPDRHRPLVVAGTLRGVPGRGIARPVVHQVQLGIVGSTSPRSRRRRSSTGRPARSSSDEFVPDRLAERGRLLRVDQHLVSGPIE